MQRRELDRARARHTGRVTRGQLARKLSLGADQVLVILRLAEQRDRRGGAAIRRLVRVGLPLGLSEMDRELPSHTVPILRGCRDDPGSQLDVG